MAADKAHHRGERLLIIIVADRYGTVALSGLSYTEMEYDYAVDKGIPVLGFVRDRIGDISFDNTERSEKSGKKLEAFRQNVLSVLAASIPFPLSLAWRL